MEQLVVQTCEVETVTLTGKKPDYEYILRNIPLQIQLRALKEDFKGNTEDHITATLDVAGYGPGEYNLPVTIELDDSVFEMLGAVRLSISIIDPNAGEDEPLEIGEGDE